MDAGKLCKISTTPTKFSYPERDMIMITTLISNALVCLSDGITLYLPLMVCSL